jgi:hypothetical protein
VETFQVAMNPLPKQNGWFKLTALFSLAWTRKWARLLDPKAGIRPALLPG